MAPKPTPCAILTATLLISLATFCSPVGAQQNGHESAQELVRAAVANTLKDGDQETPYLYRLRRERPGVGSEVRDIVMTRDGLLARLVAFNDQPPTAEQRAHDDARISKLVSDPREQAKRRRQQEEERARVRHMISALPDAFLYERDGEQQGRPSGRLIRLKFRPNPDFDPPTRETLVYKGMAGTILIDEDERRIARLDATLVETVNLGWGLVAHLDKGGRFTIDQERLPSGQWETTAMTLDFTGRAFLFKSLKIQSRQTITDFRPAPADLTLAEGVALLRKQNGIVAGK